jgi:hypothetical protein
MIAFSAGGENACGKDRKIIEPLGKAAYTIGTRR